MPREASLAERVAAAERKVKFLDEELRVRAAALLFLGSLFGLLGFFFAFVTGFLKFAEASNDYPSGNGYFPSTVSEMVANPRDPAGKAFFAFEFIGASFIFLSWYPWQLRNVYIGDDDQPCCNVAWTSFRQYIPAPGMMLVATVTTTPIQIANTRDMFTIFIHFTGAMMMFIGYVVIEAKTLGIMRFSPPSHLPDIGPRQRKWRVFFVWGVIVCYIGFFSIQIILGIPGIEAIICCPDVFEKVPGLKPGDAHDGPTLMDTAHSKFFILKLLSYIGEVLCGMSLILSHMTIWYFASERHIDLDDELTFAGQNIEGDPEADYKPLAKG